MARMNVGSTDTWPTDRSIMEEELPKFSFMESHLIMITFMVIYRIQFSIVYFV